MNGLLIFAGSKEAIDRIAKERKAYKANGSADIPAMLETLKQGGVAVASIYSVNTGYRIPEDCNIEFDESCPDEGPERLQAEGRTFSFNAYQKEMMKGARASRLYSDQEEMSKGTREIIGLKHPPYEQLMGRIKRENKTPVVIKVTEPGDEDAARIINRLSLKAPVQSPFDVEVVAEAHHIKTEDPEV